MKKNYSFEALQELGINRSGERLMLCHLIYRSVQDLSNANKKTRRNARTWFLDKSRFGKGYFPFLQTCEYLDLQADEIIKQLDTLGLFPKDTEERPDAVVKQIRGRRIYRGNHHASHSFRR